jgi:sugar lactone lactonase YvrE
MKNVYTPLKAAFFILFMVLYIPLPIFSGLVVRMDAQAPNIAYSGVAASYPINTAISALTPTNSGGAVVGLYGAVTTLAGSGASGSANGTGTAASFNYPNGVAVDASGNVYVGGAYNYRIRKITAAGVVTTLAGSGTQGSANGTGTAASFNLPSGVAVDASGNVYVADADNNRIRKITAAGVVTTLAGSTYGFVNGTGMAARFSSPTGVAVDASGNVYVADQYSHSIRKVTSAGVVTTLAGNGNQGSANGTSTAASFNVPTGVAVDASGNMYVADQVNHRIRKITAAGVVTTLAGNTEAFADGTGTAASFAYPNGVAVDASGNVYVGDYPNHRIRKITAAGVVTTLAGSNQGSANGTGTAASFNYPNGVAVDASGNVYAADQGNHRIQKVAQTGYSITPALPMGVSIDAMGVISGTPTVATLSTTYTITATNTVGSSTKTVTFAVVSVLPVELLSFSGKNTEGGNFLTWQTASEVNNKGFQIERAPQPPQGASLTWETLGFVDAKGKVALYEFIDKAPFGGWGAYRLRQIDVDGKETLSKVISIATAVETRHALSLHPNPVSNLLTVEYTEGASFQVINLLGQQVLTGKTPPLGVGGVDVNRLPQGTYVLKVGTEVAKFVKQ